MSEVSSTRLYLGNLPRTATKADVETHFAAHGTGEITEIKLMNGFGFIEYKDAMDARDVVPAFHGSTFMGERLVVQFARGARRNDNAPHFQERTAPRPRRTAFRMSITSLPAETSWQDLKDFARASGLDVVYSEVGRERDGRGFVEYETMADLRSAVEKLDNREFKGATVHCIADVFPPFPPPYDLEQEIQSEQIRLSKSVVFLFEYLVGKDKDFIYNRKATGWVDHYVPVKLHPQEERPRDRFRSRSPGPRAGGRYPPGPPDDYYGGRRDRGFSPRRDDYRRRSPPRDYYGGRDDRYARPPSRGPPRGRDDYGGPPRRYDDPYPPPVRGGGGAPYDDPYVNGHGAHGRPYAGGPPSPRRRSPGRAPPYDGGYEGAPPRRYW
ncbi:hypothetical protein Vi05172_g1417 [Venturia inaequalis]|nr:hypothetical protein Vi05172_g1417 [Venturia inaequalis]